MPELTPKIGLKKPLGNEAVNRASYNAVLDQIDAAMPVGDGDVTDAMIGSRAVTGSTAPAADAGPLGALLNGLAFMIKAITGKSSWRTAPAITLEAAKQGLAGMQTQVDSVNATRQRKISGARLTLLGGAAWVWNATDGKWRQPVSIPGLPEDRYGQNTGTQTTPGWDTGSGKNAGTYNVEIYDQPAGQLVFQADKQPPMNISGCIDYKEVAPFV